MPAENPYFLTDDPKPNLRDADAFGHRHYSNALLSILENNASQKPFTIGLFGRWGVGKTSIVNELLFTIDELARLGRDRLHHTYQVVELDVWEFNSSSFRREFLLSLASKFNCLEEVRKKLTTTSIVEKSDPPTLNPSTILQAIGQFVVIFVFWLAAFLAITKLGETMEIPPGLPSVASIILALATGIITVAQENVKKLFTFKNVSIHSDPIIHPDQFRKEFKDILRHHAKVKKPNDRLVIVLDNLDRVSEDMAIQVLAAVKTFLKEDKCIYILPCDDKGLKEHIKSSRTGWSGSRRMSEHQANEYFRKFFHTTLTVRDILAEDLTVFVDEEVALMNILDLPEDSSSEPSDEELEAARSKNQRQVSAILQVAISKNPRRIKQLINKLTTNYFLIVERGKANPDISNSVLGNLGFLAKLTVIEEEWPDFYDLVSMYPDTMRSLRSYFITEEDDLLPQALSRLLALPTSSVKEEWDSGLQEFLRRTSHIQSQNVSDFIFLKRRPSISQIANYHLFVDASRSRDHGTVKEIVDDPQTDQRIALVELVKDISVQHGINNTTTVISLVSVVCKLARELDAIPASDLAYAANVVAEHLSKTTYSKDVMNVDIDDLIKLLSYSTLRENKEVTLDTIIGGIDLENETEESGHYLEVIAGNHAALSPLNRKSLREALKPFSDKEPHQAILEEFAAKALATGNERFIKWGIPRELFTHKISLLKNHDQSGAEAFKFVNGFLRYLDEAGISYLIEVLLSLLSQRSDPLPPQVQFAFGCLEQIDLNVIPKSKTPDLVSSFSAIYSSLSQLPQKDLVTSQYIRLLPAIPQKDQAPYVDNLIDTINRSSPSALVETIEGLEPVLDSLSRKEDIYSAISRRAVNHLGNASVRLAFFKLSESTKNPEGIINLATNAWPQPAHGIASLDEAKPHLRAAKFRELLLNLVEATDSLPPTTHEERLEAIAGHKDRFTKDFRKTLAEEIVNDWLRKPAAESRKAGLKIWDSFSDESDDERGYFYDELLSQIESSVNDDTISNQENALLVSSLNKDIQLLDSDQKKKYLTLCLRMTAHGKPVPVRRLGYATIGQIAEPDLRQSNVATEMIEDLGQETIDEIKEQILETLISYKDDMTKRERAALRKVFDERIDDETIQLYLADFSNES